VFIEVMLSRRASRGGLAIVTAAVAATGTIAVATLAPISAPGRAVEHIPSNVLLYAQEKAKPFRGRVTAPGLACKQHRKVRVFRASNRRLVAKTKTNNHGRWFIPAHSPNGSFFARVTRATRENRGGNRTYLCQRDASPVRHFGS
jgi:hypothetical protein